jgi:DNA anti-recombination protein RmuC
MSSDMERFCGDLTASFDDRKEGVNNIAKETAGLLATFDKEQAEMAGATRNNAMTLRKNLKEAEADRLRKFKSFHNQVKGLQNERHNRLKAMFAEFTSEFNALKDDRRHAADSWKNFTIKMSQKRGGAFHGKAA